MDCIHRVRSMFGILKSKAQCSTMKGIAFPASDQFNINAITLASEQYGDKMRLSAIFGAGPFIVIFATNTPGSQHS